MIDWLVVSGDFVGDRGRLSLQQYSEAAVIWQFIESISIEIVRLWKPAHSWEV